MLTAVLFLTWKCNFNCPYCWEKQAQKHGKFTPEPFLESSKWVEALNRLGIDTLDITGGEPFIQPDFYGMLEGLTIPRIAITTNISFDLTSFVQRISPQKVFSMTVSYHPTSNMSFDEFLGKCLFLRNSGYNITVNFVAYPEQMYLIPMLQNMLSSAKIRLHVDPYIQTEYFPYTFSEQEKAFLAPYVGQDRANFFQKDDGSAKYCSGGRTHLNIHPTGDAYRCIHDKVLSLPKVGNIFDKDFRFNREDTLCTDWVNCSGCDRDKVLLKSARIIT
jgi:MoaA/NifB/PqqE/SkfB family radical SAM enzyme